MAKVIKLSKNEKKKRIKELKDILRDIRNDPKAMKEAEKLALSC